MINANILGITHDQFHIDNSLLSITDSKRNPLLIDCTAGMQLSNGIHFSLGAMETVHHYTHTDAVVTGGGDQVLPRMEWRAELVDPGTVRISLSVTNTTTEPLAIERLDVLICPGGYRNIPTDKLYFRRNSWQTFGPAAVRQPFESNDPWHQPPMYAPMLPPSSEDQRRLPWMTVLQSDDIPPLLVGFGSAKNYLGIIKLRSDTLGHRITASNYPEGVELMPGATINSEPLLIMWDKDTEDLLGGYGDAIADAMSARRSARPTGWCSWNYYFHKVTEADIHDTLRIIKERDLPFEYVQIDDGYQAYIGDWLRINKKQFPHGMKAMADAIREAGYKPGIWVAPFWADERSETFQQHPDWFIADANGRPFNSNHHGDQYWPAPNYGLDLTHPDAYAWIKDVLTTMKQDWGFEYFKVDFTYAACLRGKRYDQSYTSVQAYQRGMDLMREVLGDSYLLGSGAPLLPSVGTFDAMRISGDVMPSAPKKAEGPAHETGNTMPLSRDNIASLWTHAWMNGRLWVNDPDTVRTRQHEINNNWEEINSLATIVALTGGSIIDSDNLNTLEPEGYALLGRLFPPAEVRARVVGKSQTRPSKLSATVHRGDGQWHLAARYNWTKEIKPFRFLPTDWELPLGRYHIYDLMRQKYIGTRFYQRSADIPPYGAGLLSLCPAHDYPQVVATSGHLLGPAGDIENITWDGSSLTIDLPAGHHLGTTLLLHVPPLLYSLRTQEGCDITAKKSHIYTLQPTSRRIILEFSSVRTAVSNLLFKP